MSLRKFFSSATTSWQDEDATSGDDTGPSKKRCTSAPPSANPTGLTRRILDLILNGKPSSSG